MNKKHTETPQPASNLTDQQQRILRAAGIGAGAGAIGHVGYRFGKLLWDTHKYAKKLYKKYPELKHVKVPKISLPPDVERGFKNAVKKQYAKYALKGAAVGLPVAVIAQLLAERIRDKKGKAS